MTIDPKDLAVQRFAPMNPLDAALDVIMRCATDPPVVVASLLDALRPAARPGARIAEFGFGSGGLLDAMAPAFPDSRIIGLDLSPAMARGAQARFGDSVAIMLGDMERLPFRDGSLDAIATCWTLYFMRDIDAAIEEMKRCLRPGGIFVTATVAPDNMREYEAMGVEAARIAGAGAPDEDVGKRFDTESAGAFMDRHFASVQHVDWRGEMVVPDLESLLSLWNPYGPDLPEAGRARALAAFRTLAADHLAAHGDIRITRHSAAFVGHA